MASTFTPNKSIQQPANGDFSGDWNVPVNADWTIVDTAFGGTTALSVTSQTGTINLTATQLQPAILNFTGTLTANLNYQIPATIGGVWVVSNAATGAFTLTLSWASGGGSVVVPQGYIVQIYCDASGGGVSLTNTGLQAGANTQVAYNSGGVLKGSANLTFNGTTLTANALGVTNALNVGGASTVASTFAATGFYDYSTSTELLWLNAANEFTRLNGGSGALAFQMGGTGDQTNYHLNNTHAFLSSFASGSVGMYTMNAASFGPDIDNASACGNGGFRWTTVYAVNGTIQTSDEREKNIFGPSLGLDFIERVKPVSYAYKIDKPGTVRQGVVAQQLLEALDGQPFAGLRKDNDIYGVNYSEFVAPLIKAVQELSARVAALESQFAGTIPI